MGRYPSIEVCVNNRTVVAGFSPRLVLSQAKACGYTTWRFPLLVQTSIIVLTACGVSIGEPGSEYWDYKGVFEVTRYCACWKCCGKSANGRTYLGTSVEYGVVAVDPGIIALRQKVRVAGFPETFRAEDIGGAIRGYRIDVFHHSHQHCLKWGRQRRKVWLRKSGSALSRAIDGAADAVHHLGEMTVELAVLPFSFVGGLVAGA